ncbi:nitrogen fixation protein NifB [Pelosinus propionicus DSM 13327]|uniref:FeMo cofactor biosynthesis protein NifB n=2 Tax=Pelosinus TaxID=365348 RepID=A0A1I4MSI5_9FIRM|nr:nitrogenase cofactor biosynthesis protein NifB [Pelosinus propionicus]SFM06262.1 nitrogen fixation protein NifB [Pelosinus propionicus DSM 13327]
MDCPGSTSDTKMQTAAAILEKTQKHPCYSFDAHQKFARMHLPVAPYCNISCNYCNRKFDCVNESRPGVTSEILTPQAAQKKFDRVREKVGELSVVGIAGPGDALADWENTRQTIALIRKENPQIVFCLSTNGLLLPEYAQEIIELGVTHVTVTVNCLDPVIGAKIYKHINFKGQHYEGEAGVKILIENQLAGIEKLTSQGIIVKINIVMLKGINDHHIPEVVKKMKELGVYITNIMPLIPAPGSVFENFPQTTMKDVNEMRNSCELDVMQMRHCKQCRADAIGLLGEDRSQEFRDHEESVTSLSASTEQEKKIKVAVTSKQGKLVNLHFGHATEFLIYEIAGTAISLTETRQVDKYCLGMDECEEEQSRRKALIDTIADCDAVLTMRIGYHAQQRLLEHGIVSVEYCDTVEQGLLFAQQQLM